jgi:hypothetical protein
MSKKIYIVTYKHFINHRAHREHGGESMARGHSRREWGRAKTKTLQAGLPDFCFFSANPSLLGAIRG